MENNTNTSQKTQPLIIENANIIAFRVFDIGSQIFLDKAAKILETEKTLSPFVLRKTKKSILISETPLVINLEPWSETIEGIVYELASSCKVWSFGTVSIRTTLTLSRDVTLDDLYKIADFLENNESFHDRFLFKVKQLIKVLEPATEKPELWDQYEDYIVFDIQKIKNFNGDLLGTFTPQRITPLLLGENAKRFASQAIQPIEKSIFQYTEDDFVIVHWGRSIIYDPDDVGDITLTLEFALCSLLELRFYDDLLDKQLKTLYEWIEGQENKGYKKKTGLFSNPYKEISNTAAMQYIDISEIVDRVGNAFKVVGDYYYANIFRYTLQRFYIGDWRKSVHDKLSNLAEVSRLFQGEIEGRREQIFSIIIIILIAIEVVPLIYSAFWQP